MGRQGRGLKAGKSERKRKRLISQSVRHRERDRDRETERESKEAAQEMSARNGKKKRQSDGNRNDKTKQIKKKHPKQPNQVLACYFFRQLASCIHPLLPPPRWYQRTPSCSRSCCFPRTKTHTHTHTHSLSLSLPL